MKHLDEDVINLRFKHYQGRLIDTLNRILDERKKISIQILQSQLSYQL